MLLLLGRNLITDAKYLCYNGTFYFILINRLNNSLTHFSIFVLVACFMHSVCHMANMIRDIMDT